MSGWEYVRSLGVGAATGFIASFGSGIFTGAFAGGSSAFLNEIHEQTLQGYDYSNQKWGSAGISALTGAGTGFLAGTAQRAFRDVITLPAKETVPVLPRHLLGNSCRYNWKYWRIINCWWIIYQ